MDNLEGWGGFEFGFLMGLCIDVVMRWAGVLNWPLRWRRLGG